MRIARKVHVYPLSHPIRGVQIRTRPMAPRMTDKPGHDENRTQAPEGNLPTVARALGGAEEMLTDLQTHVFRDQSFKLHRTGPDGVCRVEVHAGKPAGDGGVNA